MLLADATRDGFNQIDAASIVPESVLPWKLRAEIERRGLTSQISSFIALLPASERIIFGAAWEYVSDPVSRGSSFVAAISAGLALNKETVDDIFRKANYHGMS